MGARRGAGPGLPPLAGRRPRPPRRRPRGRGRRRGGRRRRGRGVLGGRRGRGGVAEWRSSGVAACGPPARVAPGPAAAVKSITATRLLLKLQPTSRTVGPTAPNCRLPRRKG
ncbi:hypothetical protein SLNWT_2301 [Streptomyces albus]|uniref:Uncharacterized protein n=1 Tax=Streptomyces albus (strain ATCC 21838 / DSM 41398 / FERM P-419 / JCM 4703 / NBRC 107858) TaxID=1081613 RepID=A0A0B5EX25_STRA4|nr:hypothetical protein SLNWT_2301 [Streptomyces albus]AOU76990.1 hypothetical protein SLNHY_2299 [Streptomyces albus]